MYCSWLRRNTKLIDLGVALLARACVLLNRHTSQLFSHVPWCYWLRTMFLRHNVIIKWLILHVCAVCMCNKYSLSLNICEDYILRTYQGFLTFKIELLLGNGLTLNRLELLTDKNISWENWETDIHSCYDNKDCSCSDLDMGDMFRYIYFHCTQYLLKYAFRDL